MQMTRQSGQGLHFTLAQAFVHQFEYAYRVIQFRRLIQA